MSVCLLLYTRTPPDKYEVLHYLSYDPDIAPNGINAEMNIDIN